MRKYMEENYGKIKAKDIATELNISINKVYKMAQEYSLTTSLNPIFDLNDIQHQILVSGKIGDGNFKKNGSNYYYREVHSVKEKEYLLWKYNQMGSTTTGKTYNHKRRKETQNDQISFQTRNSSVFTKYAEMTNSEAIGNMNELGLVLLALDDGWCRRYTNSFGFAISVGGLNEDEQILLREKYESELQIQCKLHSRKSVTNNYISINSKESSKLLQSILKYFSKDTDIIQNKFQQFVN